MFLLPHSAAIGRFLVRFANPHAGKEKLWQGIGYTIFFGSILLLMSILFIGAIQKEKTAAFIATVIWTLCYVMLHADVVNICHFYQEGWFVTFNEKSLAHKKHSWGFDLPQAS